MTAALLFPGVNMPTYNAASGFNIQHDHADVFDVWVVDRFYGNNLPTQRLLDDRGD
jgi:hypothetical protein